MGTVPTGRLTGLDGMVLAGATAGTSDVYTGADMRGSTARSPPTRRT